MQRFAAEAVVGEKMVQGRLHYLVRWMGYPDADNTWEPASRMLEDLGGPESDMPNLVHRYLGEVPALSRIPPPISLVHLICDA